MYVRRIELRQWACHDALSVALGPGLNVCVGRNGVGKSTLYQAILAAMTRSHTSKGQDVGVFEAWGTSGFGPTVVLDLVRADGPWRLTKTYLHKPACVLERERDGRWASHRNGKPAEELLEAWLTADGASGRLLLALWSPQHDPTQVFEASSRTSKLAPATVLEHVLDRVQRPETSGPFSHVKQAVARPYFETFTPKVLKVVKDSDLDKARQHFEKAEARRSELALKRRELEDRIVHYQAMARKHQDDCRNREALRDRKADRDRAQAEHDREAATLRAADDHARALRQDFEKRAKDARRLDKAVADLARTESEIRDLLTSLDDAQRALDAAGAALDTARERQRTGESFLDEYASLVERARCLDEARESVQGRRDEVKARRLVLDRAIEAEQAAKGRSGAAESDLERARAVVRAVDRARRRDDFEVAEREWRAAEDAFRAAENAQRAGDRTRTLERVDRVRALIREREAIAPADLGPIPSAGQIADWRCQLDELRRLERDLAADALTLRFEATSPREVRLSTDGGEPSVLGVQPGEILEVEGATGLSLVIDGIGRIDLGRRSADPGDRLRRRQEIQGDLAESFRPFGTDDLESLDERRRRAEARSRIGAQIDALLAGETLVAIEARLAELDSWFARRGIDPGVRPPSIAGASLDQLRDRRDAAETKRAAARARSDDRNEPDLEWPRALPGPAEAHRELERTEQEFRAAVGDVEAAGRARVEAEAEWRAAARQLVEAEKDLADEAHGDAETAIIELENQIEGVMSSLRVIPAVPQSRMRGAIQTARRALVAQVEAARSQHDDAEDRLNQRKQRLAAAQADRENLADRLHELREEMVPSADDEARARLLRELEGACLLAEAEVRRRRESLPPDPSSQADDLDEQLRSSEAECERVDKLLIALHSEVNTRGGEGLDSELAEAEEEVDRARRNFEDHRRDAAAWALLHHLLQEVESDQASGIAARIEALASEMVPRLTGRNVGGITLDPATLAPLKARSDHLDMLAGIERFSRGTREQVALACRLQIGLLLGRESRQMLLLDDPLAHSDPNRHREALRVLEELAERLQLIIFTCHHDRYLPLWDEGPAVRIDIGAGPLAAPVEHLS